MKTRDEILFEINALRATASDYDTERQSNDTCVAAGAHDALRWALGLAETPISGNFASVQSLESPEEPNPGTHGGQ